MKRYFIFFIISLNCLGEAHGQNISLLNQFNGRYDFTFIGNTLNTIENNTIQNQPPAPPCIINTSSSADLSLNPTDEIEKAYLYWAGSGNGDFNVKLNDQDITAERTFSLVNSAWNLSYFSAFKDITEQIISTGNGLYTFSDLDLTGVISNYCPNGTNFGGWAIIVVYKNSSLPLNQLNVYDGLEALVPAFQGDIDLLTISLQNLNVIDNVDAKIGFLAWEGDKNISVNETLQINGNVLSTPNLNPSNNAFNGTNSITGSDTLYNMDLDVYDIQNNIHVGDTSATIQMTSGQDFVMINTIITKFNSQLPDATITVDNILKECDSRTILVDYTVSNLNCTDPLLPGTPVSVYVNDQLFQTFFTTVEIPIDGSVSGQVLILIPDTATDFKVTFAVDDIGNGTGITAELIENNNSFSVNDSLWISPKYNSLEPLVSCNEGFTKGTFDFSVYEEMVKQIHEDKVSFHETLEDVSNKTNPISNTFSYIATTTPKQIFVRIENENCYSITSFTLTTKNCPPTVYNYISVNNDSKNDTFHIEGLRDIFLDYKLEIYNRWGKLLWTGNQNKPEWDGYVEDGIGSKRAPDGTYFYLLFLNDPDYDKPLVGYLYLNH